MTKNVRVASVQMALQHTPNAEHLFARVEHFVRAAADYDADFIVFPEHFTLQLLSGAESEIPAADAVARLTNYTGQLRDVLISAAKRWNINIIGGSHATIGEESGEQRNISLIVLRDGTVHAQPKIQPTPDEREVWNINGGDQLRAIDTDSGRIGVLICYDSEFPELARHLALQDIDILFVPYCTDLSTGHWRVRHCCAARTVENQHYVVTSGLVGTISGVANMDTAYAQSAILTPCDIGFACDGIAAQAEPQVEQMIIADLDLQKLAEVRKGGAVRPLTDRRDDLYKPTWTGKN